MADLDLALIRDLCEQLQQESDQRRVDDLLATLKNLIEVQLADTTLRVRSLGKYRPEILEATDQSGLEHASKT
jgi:hypothetical protein